LFDLLVKSIQLGKLIWIDFSHHYLPDCHRGLKAALVELSLGHSSLGIGEARLSSGGRGRSFLDEEPWVSVIWSLPEAVWSAKKEDQNWLISTPSSHSHPFPRSSPYIYLAPCIHIV